MLLLYTMKSCSGIISIDIIVYYSISDSTSRLRAAFWLLVFFMILLVASHVAVADEDVEECKYIT